VYLGYAGGEQVRVVSAQARTKPRLRGERAKENWEAAREIYSALLQVEVSFSDEGEGKTARMATIADHIGCSAEQLIYHIYGDRVVRTTANCLS
jgi:hypothetical protein